MTRAVLAGLVTTALAGCATPPAAPSAPRAAEAPRPGSATAAQEHVCSRVAKAAPPAVRAVTLRGAGDAETCAALASRAGEPTDELRVAGDVVTLFSTQRYDDVVAVVERRPTGEVLVFELRPRPRLERVELTGDAELAAQLAGGLLGAPPAELRPTWLRETRARLVAELEARGHAAPRVEHRVSEGSSGAVKLRFEVEPGPTFALRELRIEGATSLGSSEIARALRMTRGQPVGRDLLDRDRLAAIAVLYDHGFVEGAVEAERRVDAAATAVDVILRVREGRRHLFGVVEVRAALKLPAARYAPALAKLRRGAPFSRSAVQSVVEEIEEVHRAAGVPKRVRPEPTLREGEIDLALVLEDP